MRKLFFLLLFMKVMEVSAQQIVNDSIGRYQYIKGQYVQNNAHIASDQPRAPYTTTPQVPMGWKVMKAKDVAFSDGSSVSTRPMWNEISGFIKNQFIGNFQLVWIDDEADIYVNQNGKPYLAYCEKKDSTGKRMICPNRLMTADKNSKTIIDFTEKMSKNSVVLGGSETVIINNNVSSGSNTAKADVSELQKAMIGLAGSTSNLNKVVADHEVRITTIESKVLTLEEKQAILEKTVAKNKQEFYDYIDNLEDEKKITNRQSRQIRNEYDDYYDNNQYQNQSLTSYFGNGGQGYQNSNCQSFWGGSGFTLGFSVSAGYSSYQPNTLLGSNFCSGQGGGYGGGGGYTSIYNDYSVNNSNNTYDSYNRDSYNRDSYNTNKTNTTTTNNYPRGNEGHHGGGTTPPPPPKKQPGWNSTDSPQAGGAQPSTAGGSTPKGAPKATPTNMPTKDPAPRTEGWSSRASQSSTSRGNDNFSSGSGLNTRNSETFNYSNSSSVPRSSSRGSSSANFASSRGEYGSTMNTNTRRNTERQNANSSYSYDRGSAGSNSYSNSRGSNSSPNRTAESAPMRNSGSGSYQNYAPTPQSNGNYNRGSGNSGGNPNNNANSYARASYNGGSGRQNAGFAAATPRMNQVGGGGFNNAGAQASRQGRR